MHMYICMYMHISLHKFICAYLRVCVCVCVLACPYGVNGTTDTGLQDEVRGAEFAALALPQGIPLLLTPIRITWPHSLWHFANHFL